jgi:hypothetical protein
MSIDYGGLTGPYISRDDALLITSGILTPEGSLSREHLRLRREPDRVCIACWCSRLLDNQYEDFTRILSYVRHCRSRVKERLREAPSLGSMFTGPKPLPLTFWFHSPSRCIFRFCIFHPSLEIDVISEGGIFLKVRRVREKNPLILRGDMIYVPVDDPTVVVGTFCCTSHLAPRIASPLNGNLSRTAFQSTLLTADLAFMAQIHLIPLLRLKSPLWREASRLFQIWLDTGSRIG